MGVMRGLMMVVSGKVWVDEGEVKGYNGVIRRINRGLKCSY